MDYNEFKRVTEQTDSGYDIVAVLYAHPDNSPSTEEINKIVDCSRKDIFNILIKLQDGGVINRDRKEDIMFNSLTGRGMNYCDRYFELDIHEFRRAYDDIDWSEPISNIKDINS
jgi:hypothetical protein